MEEKQVPHYGQLTDPVRVRGIISWSYRFIPYDAEFICKCGQALMDISERTDRIYMLDNKGTRRECLPLIQNGRSLRDIKDLLKELRITVWKGGPVTVCFTVGKDTIRVEATPAQSQEDLRLLMDRAVHAALDSSDIENCEGTSALRESDLFGDTEGSAPDGKSRKHMPGVRLPRWAVKMITTVLIIVGCFAIHIGAAKLLISRGYYERGFSMLSSNLLTKRTVHTDKWQQKNVMIAAQAEFEKGYYDHAIALLERVPDKEEARFIQLRDACLYSKAISDLPFSLDTLGPQKDSFMTLEKNKKDVWTESKNMFAACVEHPYAKKLAQLMTLIEKRENGEAMSIIWALHEEGYTDVDMVALAKRLRKRDLPRMADGYLKYLKEYAEIVGGPSFSAESVAAALEKIDLTGIAENRIVATGALDALVEKTGSKENGSVLILLKGEAPMTYASDVLMELLPADLRPASLEEVSYIVVIECWTTVEGYYGHFPLEADALREHAVLYVYSSGSTTPVFQSKEYKGPNPPKTIEYSSPFPPDTSGGPPDIEEPLFEMMKKYIPGLS